MFAHKQATGQLISL